MLDFAKEKMVKVAALKNLPNVLKMHKGNNQQERSARKQKDGPELHRSLCAVPVPVPVPVPAPEEVASPFGFSAVFPPQAQPLLVHFGSLK